MTQTIMERIKAMQLPLVVTNSEVVGETKVEKEMTEEMVKFNKELSQVSGEAVDLLIESRNWKGQVNGSLTAELKLLQDKVVELGWKLERLQSSMEIQYKSYVEWFLGNLIDSVMSNEHASKNNEYKTFSRVSQYTWAYSN